MTFDIITKMDSSCSLKSDLKMSAQRRFFQWAVKWFYTQIVEDVSKKKKFLFKFSNSTQQINISTILKFSPKIKSKFKNKNFFKNILFRCFKSIINVK